MNGETIEAVFRAVDGSTHPEERLARARNRMMLYNSTCEKLLREVADLLIESSVTADGFKLSEVSTATFYKIASVYQHPLPFLKEVTVWDFHKHISFTEVGAHLVFRWWDTSGFHEDRIADLYSSRERAEAALLIASESRLSDYAKQVESRRRRCAHEGSL